jgi:hypothetical protein
MIAGEDRIRECLLTRLRKDFVSPRSPRATLCAILLVTGGAGFIGSVVMLRCGLG